MEVAWAKDFGKRQVNVEHRGACKQMNEALLILVKYVFSPLLALCLSTLITFLFRRQLSKIIHESIRDAVAEGVHAGFQRLWGESPQRRPDNGQTEKRAENPERRESASFV